MQNHLSAETSPYLLQHAGQPVEWYPWGAEAFARAKKEDRPVFVSIGYSTCHWCHVMAHESFEDEEIAELLNRFFVSIKVDKEERPDIDSVYMAVCQAFTGGGGWPTSVFMTPEQRPFYAGTYFPKTSRHGMTGFRELLHAVHEKWTDGRESLLASADGVLALLNEGTEMPGAIDEGLISEALDWFKRAFDETWGGFGRAPKFPTPHHLLFLLDVYERREDRAALRMAETTLEHMYRGGLFDHIGYGFSRYSTDRYFLTPHFEKMLYDNALLLLAYARAYAVTKNPLYRAVAEKTATYALCELRGPEGGFYSAQDADSDGVEGKYYVFEPDEVERVLGRNLGKAFNERYGITPEGNFEGKSIPNLLRAEALDGRLEDCLPALYKYRKSRCRLHLDDKILTAWNGMMIAALAGLFRATGERSYLEAARAAPHFVEERLREGDTLYVSYREGKRGGKGFLDDYAYFVFALLALYGASPDAAVLEDAKRLADKASADFEDKVNGGFTLYGRENEALVLKPKETYDGATPSGNSVMAYNLVRLAALTGDERFRAAAERQLSFLSGAAKEGPSNHSFFLLALSRHLSPPERVVVVLGEPGEREMALSQVNPCADVLVLDGPTPEYSLLNGRTTFYVCKGHACLPPVNAMNGTGNA